MFVTWIYMLPLAAAIILVGHNALTCFLQYEKYRYVRQRAAEMAAEEEEVEEEEGWAANWGRRRAQAQEEEEGEKEGEEEGDEVEEEVEVEEDAEVEEEEVDEVEEEAEEEVEEEGEVDEGAAEEKEQEKIVEVEETEEGEDVPLPSSPSLDTAFIAGTDTPSEVEDTWVDDCILKNEQTEFTEEEKKEITEKLETLASHSYFN